MPQSKLASLYGIILAGKLQPTRPGSLGIIPLNPELTSDEKIERALYVKERRERKKLRRKNKR